MALAARAPRAPLLPADLGIGLVSMLGGGCLVGWAIQQPTLGGLVAAGCGAMMVFVGTAWTGRAMRVQRA